MSISSSSSFERVDSAASDAEKELNASFLSVYEAAEQAEEEDVRSESPSSEFDESVDREKAMRDELENLRIQCAQQRLQIALMAIEMEEHKKDAKSDEDAFKMAIAGHWKFSSSTNLQPFLKKRREVANSTDLDDVIFHVAEQNIEFSDGVVIIYETVGKMQFNEHYPLLGASNFTESGAHVTYISGDVLKTVRIREAGDVEKDVEERFVKDGQLHVVTHKYGETCTRVYTNCNDASEVNGLWRQLSQPNRTISLEIRDGRLYRKIRNVERKNEDVSDDYKIGDPKEKWRTSVERNVLVQRMVSSEGEVTLTRKRFVEDGKLVSVEEPADGKFERWTFERVGPPLAI